MFSAAQVEQLLRPVNPRRVQRNDKGMSHLAAYDVSAHLTRIFGFGGWRKEILALDLVAEDAINDEKRNGRLGWYVTYRCTMRLHVGEWWNDDGATGSASNLPDRGDAHDFAMKNAISYALKRCAKDLGDQFGLSLYNKGSTAALVGRVLARAPSEASETMDGAVSDVEADLPELAPDWDEQPPGREDRLPVNADGSLSRSRTSDAEKDAAGVMTSGQLAEHTALQPKRAEQPPAERLTATPDDSPWYDTGKLPEAWLPAEPQTPRDPRTITREQSRKIHAGFTALGLKDRESYLKWAGRALGFGVPLASTSDLSYKQAGDLLAALATRQRAEKMTT